MACVDRITSETSHEAQPHKKRHLKTKKNVHCHSVIHETDEQIQLEQKFQSCFTRRQLAEIQLEGIMNDPELSLLQFANDETRFKLEDLAARLCTQPWLIKRILHTLGAADTDSIGARDIHTLTRVLTSSFDARLLLFFNIIDIDHDRLVSKEELMLFFSDYLDGITFFQTSDVEEEVRRKTILTILLAKFNLHQVSQIDFDQFHELVLNDKLLIEALSRFTVHPSWFDIGRALESKKMNYDKEENVQSSWTLKALILFVLRNNIRMCQSLYDGLEEKLSRDYLYDNLSRVIFTFIYLSVSIALFIFVIVYRVQQQLNWLEVIARICGMQLNFNCMMMIVLMLRYTMRLIRSNRILYNLVPVDDAISIHKMIGCWIFVLVFIHALFHMIYFGVGSLGYSWADCMFTARAHIGWLGITPLLGIFLSMVLIVMGICSLKFVRRGGHFEVFYLTHLLYIVFYILLILHARNFWHWLIGPGVIFVLEKIYYLYKRHSTAKGHTLLHSVTIEQANVVKLTIYRPPGFHFRAGDYVLLNIPQIARWEWHPFTLTSAPEDREFLTVHIQSAGNWTGKVFDRYKQIVDQKPNTPETDLEAAPFERVLIDGPYTSSARYVFNCSHAILIGVGIGITPYASILTSLLAQYRSRNYHGASSDIHKRLVTLDFVWINRSTKNFEWFVKLLATFEKEQESWERTVTTSMENTIEGYHRFLDLHLYFTDIKQDPNIGSVPLDLVTRVYEQAYHEDVFTRLKTKTHVGRPNWDELFDTILAKDSQNKKKDAAVFFCGPKSMTEMVKAACTKHKIKFHKEQF